jgi:DNA-directed RNA polymerase specialized sigma24 family protein
MSELSGRHYASSLNMARGIHRRHEDAQDVAQAAFMMAFRRLESPSEPTLRLRHGLLTSQ